MFFAKTEFILLYPQQSKPTGLKNPPLPLSDRFCILKTNINSKLKTYHKTTNFPSHTITSPKNDLSTDTLNPSTLLVLSIHLPHLSFPHFNRSERALASGKKNKKKKLVRQIRLNFPLQPISNVQENTQKFYTPLS